MRPMDQKYLRAAFRVALLSAGVTIAAAPTWAQDLGKEALAQSIVVSGVGEVKVTPDIARIELGVQTQDKDSAKAVQQNANIADAVIKAVRAAGVAEADVQTTNYSIQPSYDPASYGKPTPPKVNGFQVMNTVRVTVRKLADTGKVIDSATKVGANWGGGISLDLNDADKQKAEDAALAKAVTDARRKADIIAKAAGVGGNTALRLLTVSESGGGGGPVMPLGRGVMFAKADAATPIVAGEQTITASVSVRYGFNQ